MPFTRTFVVFVGFAWWKYNWESFAVTPCENLFSEPTLLKRDFTWCYCKPLLVIVTLLCHGFIVTTIFSSTTTIFWEVWTNNTAWRYCKKNSNTVMKWLIVNFIIFDRPRIPWVQHTNLRRSWFLLLMKLLREPWRRPSIPSIQMWVCNSEWVCSLPSFWQIISYY